MGATAGDTAGVGGAVAIITDATTGVADEVSTRPATCVVGACIDVVVDTVVVATAATGLLRIHGCGGLGIGTPCDTTCGFGASDRVNCDDDDNDDDDDDCTISDDFDLDVTS